MNSSAENVPLKPNRIRHWLRRLGWIAIWIVTLVVLAIVVENWLGARAWRAYVAEARAAGERLEPGAIVPPPVRDEENFAAIPLFRPLFDYVRAAPSPNAPQGSATWRDPAAKERLDKLRPFGEAGLKPAGDWRQGQFVDLAAWEAPLRGADSPTAAQPPGAALLHRLARFDPEMDALRAGASRPHSRFPINYEDHVGALLPHLGMLRTFASIAQVRALAELSLGDTAAAHRDLLLGLRLADAVSAEPSLISHLVQIAQLELAMPPLWEGLVRHQWNDAQLAASEAALARVDLIAGFQLAIRGERTLLVGQALDAMKEQPHLVASILAGTELSWVFPSLLTAGKIDFNKVHLGRYYDKLLDTVVPAEHRYLPDAVTRFEQEFTREIAARRFHPHKALVALVFPSVVPALERSAATQATVDLTRCAIALDRHRLQYGSLPDTLDALAPSFLPRVPHDVVSGGALHYRRGPGDGFLLYSVGWNGRDDGGKYAWKPDAKPPRVDWQQGDWPWPQPAGKKRQSH